MSAKNSSNAQKRMLDALHTGERGGGGGSNLARGQGALEEQLSWAEHVFCDLVGASHGESYEGKNYLKICARGSGANERHRRWMGKEEKGEARWAYASVTSELTEVDRKG